MDLSKLSDLAGGLGKGLDKLDLQQVITDQFMKDNTTLDSVQALLNKLGVGSLVDLNKISPEILDQVVQSISKFGSWKDLLAKAAGSGLGDKLGGFFK